MWIWVGRGDTSIESVMATLLKHTLDIFIFSVVTINGIVCFISFFGSLSIIVSVQKCR